MNPLYFPFTFIPEPVLETLSSFFKRTIVYQPSEIILPESMRLHSEKGLLDVRVPVKGDEEKIRQIVRDFGGWLEVHKGADLDYLKRMGDQIPFFDETLPYRVKAELKESVHRLKNYNIPNSLFSARLFLYLAQDLDIKNWEICLDLKQVAEMQRQLFDRLKGDEAEDTRFTDPQVSLGPYEPDPDKVEERLLAWTVLFLNDDAQRGPDASLIFVTPSRLVIEHLLENGFEAAKILTVGPGTDSDTLRRMKELLMECRNSSTTATTVGQFGQTPGEITPFTSSEPHGEASLSVFRISNVSPIQFFARRLNSGAPFPSSKPCGVPRDTLIGFLETRTRSNQ